MRVWKRIKINSSIEPCCMLVKHLTMVGKKVPAECSQRGKEGKMKCSEMVQSCREQDLHAWTLSCRPEFSIHYIAQKTPIRVLHHRSAATRERMIYTMRGELVN